MPQLILRAGLAAGALLAIARAQTAVPPPGPPVTLAPVEVTGTRLGRPLAESPAPALVIDRDEIERSGRTNLADLLRDRPEFPGTGINDNVAISTTRGSVALELRGLGAGNTLVLVNGRRTSVSANAFGDTVFVDGNRFPPAAIERVEVLKGGASAVYGADAVAGVVNLITRRLPSGGEWRLSYGNTFDRDAAELEAAVATGASRERLGLTVSASFLQRHALASRDRSFSRTANLVPRFAGTYAEFAALPAGTLAGYDGRSLTAPNARFSVAAGQVNGQGGVDIPGLAAGTPITALPGTGGEPGGTLAQATPGFAAPFREATGGPFQGAAAASFVAPELTRGDPAARNLFNFNEHIWLVPAAERAGFGGRLDFAATRALALFAEAGVQHNVSRTEFMPVGVSATVPRTNPYNPFGVDVNTVWRIADAGPRRSRMVDEAFSLVAGARSTPGAALAWETAASYSRDDYRDTTTNVLSAARVLAALASPQRATALNPFGGESFHHAAAVIDPLKIATWFAGWADLASVDARASGTLLRTPFGPVEGAAYLERRHERFNAFSDPATQAGDGLGFGATGPDARYVRHATALAFEARAPWSAAAPGAAATSGPRAALEAAARMENFAGSFRSGFRPSVGLVAQPGAGLIVRASQAWTFRAPSLLQLHAPQSTGYANSMPDPRRPVALTGDLFDGPNVSRLIREGGNPALGAETGRVFQFGLAWQPPRLGGLALEAGWFRYEMENLITGIGGAYALANELSGLGHLVHREAGSETYVNRTGAPIPILSGANGQTRDIAPGESVTVPGRLQQVDSYLVNLSRRRLVGWDFAARYTLETTRRARWIATVALTGTIEASSAFDRFSPLIDYSGAGSQPLWRARATLDHERGAWSVGASFHYTPSSGSHRDLSYVNPYRLVHLRAAWTAPRDSWLRHTQFSAGIDDLFNEEPPLANDPPVGYATFVVARPQQRFWRVAVKRTW
jgi:outer membrane receptor protein involved in Fe transport